MEIAGGDVLGPGVVFFVVGGLEEARALEVISACTWSSPRLISAASAFEMMPCFASMAAWALEPLMSCAKRRWSNPMEALISSMMASGPEAKRPPHILFAIGNPS